MERSYLKGEITLSNTINIMIVKNTTNSDGGRFIVYPNIYKRDRGDFADVPFSQMHLSTDCFIR